MYVGLLHALSIVILSEFIGIVNLSDLGFSIDGLLQNLSNQKFFVN